MGQRGNIALVEHGIQTENSHIRAHVCPVAKVVYVFPTESAQSIIANNSYRLVNGYQSNIDVPTAQGYLVPPFDITKCVGILLRPSVWDYLCFSADDSLSEKGQKATRLILQMLKQGLFPLAAIGTEITDKDLQVCGTDIIIRPGAIAQREIIIQVKCDYPGGDRHLGGTGNLFLQIQECNPFGYY